MSIEFSKAPRSIWNTEWMWHLALAAAGAIAFSALAGGVAIRESTMPLAPASQTQARPETSRPASPYSGPAQWPSMTIYVVSSQAEAHEVEAMLAMDSPGTSGHIHQVFVADTAEQIDLLLLMQADIGHLGTGTTNVIDMRYVGQLEALPSR